MTAFGKLGWGLLLVGLLSLGCSGVQTALDREIAKGSMGENYDEEIADNDHQFGPQVYSNKLGEGAQLYLHVLSFESSTTTWLGIWGDAKYSYKVFAFKVSGNKVKDWAYALYQPDKEYTHVFGMTFGHDEEPVIEDIKKKYKAMLKTSSEGSVANW
jgi:hypothetical protein